MELEAIGGESNLKKLIHNIRSVDETDRKQTISQIPHLVFQSLKDENGVLNQILLLIYNLDTESEIFDSLNASNRTLVIRHLLRLYTETIEEHHPSQIDALKKTVDLTNSSKLLVELAYVLHRCSSKKLSKDDSETVEEALGLILEKATAQLYPEALLMIHSILAMK